MEMPSSSTMLQGVFSLAQIGAIIYLVRVLITPIAKTVETCARSIETLFDGRNKHETRLVKIETVHALKGCSKPDSLEGTQ